MAIYNKRLLSVAVLIVAIVSIDAQTFFTNGRYGKRSDTRLRVASRSGEEVSRFFGGPRFGRSGGMALGEFDPRNPERFFIGSRYGKRSGEEQVAPPSSAEEILPAPETAILDKDIVLECVPTGVDQLYHCTKRNERTPPSQS